MTLGTHLAFASVLYLGGATLFGYRPDWVSWLLAAVASLLPNIDLPPGENRPAVLVRCRAPFIVRMTFQRHDR